MPRSSPPALSPAILQQCTLDIIVGGCGRGNLWLNSRIGQVARCNFSAYWPISFILHHPCFPLGRNGHKFAVLLCGSVKWSISQVAYGPSLALSKIAFLVWLGWLQLTLGIKSSQLTSLHQNLTEKQRATTRPTKSSLAAIDLEPWESPMKCWWIHDKWPKDCAASFALKSSLSQSEVVTARFLT